MPSCGRAARYTTLELVTKVRESFHNIQIREGPYCSLILFLLLISALTLENLLRHYAKVKHFQQGEGPVLSGESLNFREISLTLSTRLY